MAKDTKPAPNPRRGFAYHIVKLADLVMARADAALRPLDLTPLAFETMARIQEGNDLSQKALSEQLNAYAPKMVGVIDGLESRGLVERRVSPADRRRHILALTAEGRKLLERADGVVEALEQELFGELPATDKARLEALTRRLDVARNAATGK